MQHCNLTTPLHGLVECCPGCLLSAAFHCMVLQHMHVIRGWTAQHCLSVCPSHSSVLTAQNSCRCGVLFAHLVTLVAALPLLFLCPCMLLPDSVSNDEGCLMLPDSVSNDEGRLLLPDSTSNDEGPLLQSTPALCRHVWRVCLSCKITQPSRTTCEISWCRPSRSQARTMLTCLPTRQQQHERFVSPPLLKLLSSCQVLTCGTIRWNTDVCGASHTVQHLTEA